MEQEHLIHGLTRKRAELAGQIEAQQNVLRALTADLAHLDATLRLFQPGINLSGVKVRTMPGHHAALYGEMSRAIFDVLRGADHLLTVREIGAAIMDARGLSREDGALVASIEKRVGAALRNMKRRGSLRSEHGVGLALVWGMAGK